MNSLNGKTGAGMNGQGYCQLPGTPCLGSLPHAGFSGEEHFRPHDSGRFT